MQFIFIIALITLLLVRRIKRSIGFQKFNQTSLIVRMVLFGVVILSILSYAIVNPIALIPDTIGLIAGLVLAYIATHHAKFEKRADGLYFKTHVWVEMTVIALFIARIIYRVLILKDMMQPGQDQQDMQEKMQTLRDPWTSSILFVFCTYYIGYFSFILKEGKTAMKSDGGDTPNP